MPQCTDPNLLAWKAIRFGAKWNNYAGTQSYVKIPLKKKKATANLAKLFNPPSLFSLIYGKE